MKGKILQSIGDRAILFVLFLFLSASILGFGYNVYRLNQMSEEASLRNKAYNVEKSMESVRNYVAMPYSIAEGYERETHALSSIHSLMDLLANQIRVILDDPDMPLNIKREEIIRMVALSEYGDNNYFWINDRVRMVYHPDAALVGRLIDDKTLFPGPDGSSFLRQAATESSKSEDRMALVEYVWDRGTGQGPESKLAMVRYLPELDWYIGTGVYLGDFIEAQKEKAFKEIANMRLPDGNYFWINDTSYPIATMVMHPTVPSLDGTPLDAEKFNCAYMYQVGLDAEPVETDGTDNLFTLMVKVVTESGTGEGYVWYRWPKPRDDGGVTEELFPKVSYVKLFEPWGWVIGNGIYIDEIDAIVARDKAIFDREVESLVWDMGVWGSVFLLLAAVALWLFFNRSLTRPITGVVGYADKVAKGDLDADIHGYFPCETGRLRTAIRSMVAALKKAIADAEDKGCKAEEESDRARCALEEADEARKEAENARMEGLREAADRLEELVDSITSASDEIRGQVQEVVRGMDVQNERSTETATAMEEMNATVMEVARSASDAAASADQAREKAEGGAEIVRRVSEAIADVRERAGSMRGNLGELGRKAEDIGQVMNVITDIADQTNLLALNAAIEAARAGEAGRGFAVVADEVRKLAEKTMQATKEVGQAVKSIQEETKRNIQSMEGASTAVDNSTELAGEAGASLEEIVRIVDMSSDQVRAIATASEEQSATSEEISRSVEDISRIAGQTAQGMNEAEQVINRLADLADKLSLLVERLRED